MKNKSLFIRRYVSSHHDKNLYRVDATPPVSHLERKSAQTSLPDSDTRSPMEPRGTSPRWHKGWTHRRVRLDGTDGGKGRINLVSSRDMKLGSTRVDGFTDLAVLAGIAVRAVAVVLVWLRVLTRGSVLAGLVGAAVVQICVNDTGVSGSSLRKLPAVFGNSTKTRSFFRTFFCELNKGINRVGFFLVAVIYNSHNFAG